MLGASHTIGGHALETFLGFLWIGVFLMFMMFGYQYNFVVYPKSQIEDNASYKETYVAMRKASRQIAIGFLFFLIISFTLYFEMKSEFLYVVVKGGALAAIVIPALNSYYGNENRFKFTY